MNVHIKDKDYSYFGAVCFVEEHTSNPKVVLCNYKLIQMSTGETVVDYSNNSNKTIMLDTSNFDIVEIIYK